MSWLAVHPRDAAPATASAPKPTVTAVAPTTGAATVATAPTTSAVAAPATTPLTKQPVLVWLNQLPLPLPRGSSLTILLEITARGQVS